MLKCRTIEWRIQQRFPHSIKTKQGEAMSRNKKKAVVKRTLPRWVWGVIIGAVLVMTGFVIYRIANPSPAVLPAEISVAQAAQKQAQGALILDVREPSEWAQFHIPGATLIPLGDLPNRLNEVPKDREVVVVCRTGNRSAQGRDILLQAGYTNVTSMAGGMVQWQAQGLAIATGQ
jgi:rhodanese-related sulfurtransferase